MCRPAAGAESSSESPLRPESQFRLRRFAVDQISRSIGYSIGRTGAWASRLFTDYKKETKVSYVIGDQRFAGLDHGCDQTLCIASSPAVDELFILAELDK